MARLFINEAAGPHGDAAQTAQAMGWMKRVLVNRLDHPGQFDALGATRITEVIQAHDHAVQFTGFAGIPRSASASHATSSPSSTSPRTRATHARRRTSPSSAPRSRRRPPRAGRLVPHGSLLLEDRWDGVAGRQGGVLPRPRRERLLHAAGGLLRPRWERPAGRPRHFQRPPFPRPQARAPTPSFRRGRAPPWRPWTRSGPAWRGRRRGRSSRPAGSRAG